MNTRQRQIKRAERMLYRARSPETLMNTLLAGINWAAFNEAVSTLAQAMKELSQNLVETFSRLKPTELVELVAKCTEDKKEG